MIPVMSTLLSICLIPVKGNYIFDSLRNWENGPVAVEERGPLSGNIHTGRRTLDTEWSMAKEGLQPVALNTRWFISPTGRHTYLEDLVITFTMNIKILKFKCRCTHAMAMPWTCHGHKLNLSKKLTLVKIFSYHFYPK